MRLLILLGADGHHRYRTNTCDVDLRTAQKEPAASGRRCFNSGDLRTAQKEPAARAGAVSTRRFAFRRHLA
jgi:hypothetical protein